jgi:hypothetical protein
MKKNKIEVGQCYRYNDQVFMIMEGPFSFANIDKGVSFWSVQNTLTKEMLNCPTKVLQVLEKPFQNWVS